MALKRKKKHEDHVDESWLIPYADVLTLLLALFIVLFAASEVDSKKFKEIAESFNNELQGGTGILDEEAAIEIMTDTSKISKLDENEPPKEEKTEAQLAREQDMKELGELQEKIEVYIKDKGLSTKLETALTGKGLVLKIKEGVLYPSGSADINEVSRTIAVEISNLLVTDPPRNIFIDGHTDNIPANSKEFPSNWELSAARAINFMKILLENKQLDPKVFSATGYGEYHPVTTNDTPEGRAENRRVEVLISPYKQEN
ncbi:flagellar motor protein MotB [Paenisporosarcina quisquiliarum]|uniref:Flagellar motor protein MotB n=1 Tax=Paenisporosarcina quisquiliarum TaxID=365346 RepID=A0A9X3RCN0_9BACL|nr:flagellar motor protein MotB [Paenisporosarcina quisquiliarum]MCZ8536925.1 flagellar motor protein MotB [Paenisporosarcina quisquiliarum]